MKQLGIFAAAILCMSQTVMADINLQLAPEQPEAKLHITSVPIAEWAKGRKAVTTVLKDSIQLTSEGGKFTTPDFAAYNIISMGDHRSLLFTHPGDNVTAQVEVSPFKVKYSGTALIEGMNAIEELEQPAMSKYAEYRASGATPTQAQMDEVIMMLDKALIGYIEANPNSIVAPYAIMEMQNGELQIQMFEKLGSDAKTSIIYPLAEQTVARAKKTVEAEKLQDSLKEKVAPDFTLPNQDGEPVSLSQFRGKWVILDFWGSWCGWCIKGFPALKEAYKKYEGKVEVLGIDCGDSQEAWKAAIKRFELPWVQVYNAESETSVDKAYGIQGFPTKMIVSPEGKIVDITTGEDPSFFERLEKFVLK